MDSSRIFIGFGFGLLEQKKKKQKINSKKKLKRLASSAFILIHILSLFCSYKFYKNASFQNIQTERTENLGVSGWLKRDCDIGSEAPSKPSGSIGSL